MLVADRIPTKHDSFVYLLMCTAILMFGIAQFVKACRVRASLAHIPSVGHSGWLSSYLTVARLMANPIGLFQEGYTKFKGKPYKIPTMNGWRVVISDSAMIEELSKLPDDILSASEAFEQFARVSYTISPNLSNNPYHVGVVRHTLTRNIALCYADFYDEVKAAVEEGILIPPDTDWVEVSAYNTILNIFARSCNRILVGYPLCRNPDYLDLTKGFASTVMKNANMLHMFPEILHPIVGRIFSSRRQSLRQIMKHLKPVLDVRIQMQNEYGKDWVNKPTDYISWLLDDPHAKDWQRGSVTDLSTRMLDANFASIDSTSAFTHILYHLAAHPDLLQPLRAEVDLNVKKYGWTNIAMREMYFMDSFMKEVARLKISGISTSLRRLMCDFSFSDGTIIPAGTFIGLNSFSRHHNEDIYPSSEIFEADRFLDKRIQGDKKAPLTSPTSDWLFFGSGRHACPGRFFAVIALKTLLAHLVTNYDVKMKDNTGIPPCRAFSAGNVAPNFSAVIMLRKRQV